MEYLLILLPIVQYVLLNVNLRYIYYTTLFQIVDLPRYDAGS